MPKSTKAENWQSLIGSTGDPLLYEKYIKKMKEIERYYARERLKNGIGFALSITLMWSSIIYFIYLVGGR